MSKSSIRSKLSIRSLSRQKKKKNVSVKSKKEIGFCCGKSDFDPLFKYDQRNPPFKSSLTAIRGVNECPVLKLRTQFFEDVITFSNKKGTKAKQKLIKDQREWKDTDSLVSVPDALENFIEDDIQQILERERLKKFLAYKKARRNSIDIGRKKAREKKVKLKKYPHWYQDFSNSQMNYLMILKNALTEDYKEKETFRTQNNLMEIGITSPFFKLLSKQIKYLQEKCNVSPVEFLREIYKIASGSDFELEGHKNNYNCNERLTLSAIAFLSLPETIIELNKRLPQVKSLEIPSKPKPPKVDYPKKKYSPYSETLFIPPNLRLYQVELNKWQKNCEITPKPKVILPPDEKYLIFKNARDEVNENTRKRKSKEIKNILNHRVKRVPIKHKAKKNITNYFGKAKLKKEEKNRQTEDKNCIEADRKNSDRILDELNENHKSAEKKISDTKLTSSYSQENLLEKLKIVEGSKKIFPQGRQYLSKNWQIWLQNEEEEFLKFSKEANKLIESVETTMKLVNSSSPCDNCCTCKQVKNSDINITSDYLINEFTIDNEEELEAEGEYKEEETDEEEEEEAEKISSTKKMQVLYEKNFDFNISLQNKNKSLDQGNENNETILQKNNFEEVDKIVMKNNRDNSKENIKTDLKRNSTSIRNSRNTFLSSKNKHKINSKDYDKQNILKTVNKSVSARNKSKIVKNNNRMKNNKKPNRGEMKKTRKMSRNSSVFRKQLNALKMESWKNLEGKKTEIAIVPNGDELTNEMSKREELFNCKRNLEKISAPEKTLIYLEDPIRPIESIAVKPGGKLCHCREREKKTLETNASESVNQESISLIVSPRRSDNYIPEYELYESPYGTCVQNKVKKAETIATENKNQLPLEKEFNSKEWDDALKDYGLIDFYSQNQKKTPCWLRNSTNHCAKKIRKLQVKIPVCQCQYERKIVMKKEEIEKWLNRKKKLKTYKKVPITHIAGISRPMERETTFVISGVKNIPNENGVDELKYCISGVAENNKMGQLQYLVNGVCMHTPLETPKQSTTSVFNKENILPDRLNQETIIPSTNNNNENTNKKQREKFNRNNSKKDREKKQKKTNREENRKFLIGEKLANVREYKVLQERNKIHTERKNEKEINKQDVVINIKKASHVVTDVKTVDLSNLNRQIETHQEGKKNQLNISYLQQAESNEVMKSVDTQLELKQLVRNELKKMAHEGFIFAKLPRCFDFPQLNYWIMYRRGIFLSDQDKEKLMQRSMRTWAKLKAHKSFLKPVYKNLNKKKKSELNFNNVSSLKLKISADKKLFYKQIREDRVKRSANLWNAMEFGKFPTLWFKKTFFTYLPSKHMDGHILEPLETTSL